MSESMVSNSTNSSSQPLIPIFKGEKYHLWSLKTKTMFKSQELWELVENWYIEPGPTLATGDLQEIFKDPISHPISTG